MTLKQRVKTILKHLDLSTEKNLDWVVLHLVALIESEKK
jgi:hypothetical protein